MQPIFIESIKIWMKYEKMNIRIWNTILFLFILTQINIGQTLNLSGIWQFSLDKDDKGISEKWFDRDLSDKISLPGILNSQGFGNDITKDTPWVLSLYDKNWSLREDYKSYTKPGNVKVPFLSQPPKHYLGAAWYNREIEIPANWANKRVVLFLERPKWKSTVYLDGKEIGSNMSLVAEHEYDLGVLPVGKHKLSIRVDNRMLMEYRPDAHSVSDSLGMSWNGIVGKIELRATDKIWFEDVQVYPNWSDKTATVRIKIGNSSGMTGDGMVFIEGDLQGNLPNRNVYGQKINWDEKGGTAEVKLNFPNAKEWNEFSPNLQTIKLSILSGFPQSAKKEISFGFANISTDKNEFKLNGRTIYLRGTHHGGDFPLTGYPPTDVEYWRKIFQNQQRLGYQSHSFSLILSA